MVIPLINLKSSITMTTTQFTVNPLIGPREGEGGERESGFLNFRSSLGGAYLKLVDGQRQNYTI